MYITTILDWDKTWQQSTTWSDNRSKVSALNLFLLRMYDNITSLEIFLLHTLQLYLKPQNLAREIFYSFT